MQFTSKQQELIKKALSVLSNQPEIEFESWELDNDTVIIGNQAIWAEDGKVEYTLFKIKYHPGGRFNPPEISEVEILTSSSFRVVLIELVKNLVNESLGNIIYMEAGQ